VRSDHRGLAVTVDCPRAQRREDTLQEGSRRAQERPIARRAVCTLPPSMVSWAPPHTVCKSLCGGGGGEAAGAAQDQAPVKGTRGRRRGGGVVAATPPPSLPVAECTHQEALVEVARDTNKSVFMAKAAWAPGQLAVRLLMPGAVEFAGAMTKTQAYSSLRDRMLTGAAASAKAAASRPVVAADGSGRREARVAAIPIPTSQL
jgi:hypothetical protein